MFSVLGFAFLIRRKLSQNIGFKIFLCIVIGIFAALLYQLTLSTQKLQSNLTGTKVEFMETDPNLNISISICNILTSWPMDNITVVKRFDAIFQKGKGKANAEWIEYTDILQEMVIWEDSSIIYQCKTMSFTEEEIKMIHKCSKFDAVFLHDPSFLTGYTSLKLPGETLNKNKILLMNAKQIHSIEEDNFCMNSVSYDSCRDEYIAQEFNTTFGCIYFNMK